jgi:hypothetical protein
MDQLLRDNPWLVVVVLGAIVAVVCTAIVFITDYLQKSQKLEVEAALKQDMLNRGLSADDIKTVLEASSDGAALKSALANQGVHLGLGKFKLELGAIRDNAKAT